MKGIERFVVNPLGYDSFGVRRKEWIGAAIGVLGGLASSFFGGQSASDAAKAAERRQRQQESKEGAWYTRRYNEDYVDTAAGQNLVRRAKEYARENWRKAAGAQAVSGGTAAASQMAKDAGNKMVGDTIANIAATDQMRKSQVDNMHRQAESQFAQMDMNRELQRAQNISNASAAASNALMSVGAAVDQASAKNASLVGGSNGGQTVASAPSKVTVPKQSNVDKYYNGMGVLIDDPTSNLHSV